MAHRILIEHAVVALPEGCQRTDVVIEDSRIAEIAPARQLRRDETVDGSGMVLLPGIVDDQVHFREPGLTHKEDLQHATRAAAKGGVTSILEMPNTSPTTTSCQRLHEKLELASTRSLVNYGFYIGATPHNLEELQQAQRTPGIKIFIGSSTGDLLVDDQQALERIFAETRLPICAHCEDESTIRANQQRWSDRRDVASHSLVRDEQAAVLATRRAVDLAERHRHPFHVLHVSTAAELDVLRRAPSWVTAEVCPHHLFFSVDDYARLGSLIKVNPSVKTQRDNQALWQALLDGTIEVIATDHAPHTWEEKQRPYPECPSGLPGVENSLALMLDQANRGHCTLEQIVDWMSAAPARIWNLMGKGSIVVGNDADLVLVDMNLAQTIHHQTQQSKCRWSPWDGVTLQGWPVRTWVMGREVFRWVDGKPQFDTRRPGCEIRYDQRRSGRTL